VDSLLEEYLENPDVKETTAAFVELNVCCIRRSGNKRKESRFI
jgi:hypothetical protein